LGSFVEGGFSILQVLPGEILIAKVQPGRSIERLESCSALAPVEGFVPLAARLVLGGKNLEDICARVVFCYLQQGVQGI
jgi:hypothetical protein